MKTLFSSFLGPLIFTGISAMAAAAQESIPQLDLTEAIDLLTKADFEFPAEAIILWRQNDGLPTPENAQFPKKASRFIDEHPIVPADDREPSLWDVRHTASRQVKCLAYLASGKQKARRDVASLCVAQAVRMQWALPIRAERDRTFYAATSTFSLIGGLLRSRAREGSVVHEVATQWQRIGLGQLATYGGRGNETERKAAEALVDAAQVKIESLEIHGTGQEFFSQIDLERTDMRNVAHYVASGDWQRARQAYEDTLAERFSSKHGWPDILFSKDVDILEADDICNNIFVLRAHMFRLYNFGEEVDWAKVIDHDIESRVWMNAHPWMLTLMKAYRKTGDEKYVKNLCRLFNSWYESSPPTFKRSSAQWRTLEVGGRAGLKWGVVLLGLTDHPAFNRECLFNMAHSMLDHGKYLCMYAASGGNWLQVESSGLACVALLFPEFKLSPLFYDVAMKRLAWVNADAFLPDGFQSECSPLYHRFPLTAMASALRLAKFSGSPLPESLLKQYEAGVEALQYIAYPDRTLPMLSDGNPERSSVAGVMETGAEVFGREDFRWFATEGRDGEPPVQPSHDFTHAGYCVMRDKWGPDGQVLIFDAGYFGSGHQHEDKLNFVYYAGGRELIGDPGIYSYKADAFEPYWRGTWSHNCIVIDGLSQHRALGPPEKTPDPDRRFVIGEDFDFAVGWYRRAYSPRKAPLWGSDAQKRDADRAAVIHDVQHQRCIFYVSGEYAVICDRVSGEGKHQIDLIFHPAPIITGEGTKRTARPIQLEIGAEGLVITKEPKHSNVAIIPARGKDLGVEDLIGQKDPVRGWFALFGIQRSHDIVYRCHTELPRHFETIVEALPAGDAQPMQVESHQVRGENGKTCSALSCGDDLFLISYDGPAKMACADVLFHGTVLLLRYDASSRPVRACMVDGGFLGLGGRQIFSTADPAPSHSLDLR